MITPELAERWNEVSKLSKADEIFDENYWRKEHDNKRRVLYAFCFETIEFNLRKKTVTVNATLNDDLIRAISLKTKELWGEK